MNKVVSRATKHMVVVCSFGYLEGSDLDTANCRIHLRTQGYIVDAAHQRNCPILRNTDIPVHLSFKNSKLKV